MMDISKIKEQARAAVAKKAAASRPTPATQEGTSVPVLSDEGFDRILSNHGWMARLKPAVQSVVDREAQCASLEQDLGEGRRFVGLLVASVTDDEDREALASAKTELAKGEAQLAATREGVRRAHGALAAMLNSVEREGGNLLALTAGGDLPEAFRRRLISFLQQGKEIKARREEGGNPNSRHPAPRGDRRFQGGPTPVGKPKGVKLEGEPATDPTPATTPPTNEGKKVVWSFGSDQPTTSAPIFGELREAFGLPAEIEEVEAMAEQA